MEILDSISIELALDFDPYHLLSPAQFEQASKYAPEHYFEKSIKSAGYQNIKPIHPSSFYVNVKEISDENLKRFLKKHLEDEKQNEMDEMLRLRGGTVILNSDKLIFSPTCCTDITDFDNWLDIEQTTEFKSIWIGHPWVLYKTKNDKLYLTDYIEANGDVTDDSEIRYEILYDVFLEKLKLLQNAMIEFENKVCNCLKEIGIEDYQKITNCIVKGQCEPKF